MPRVDYISEADEEPANGYFGIRDSSDEEIVYNDNRKEIYPRETISTMELIDDYISNLANAKKTVVSVICKEYISYSHSHL